MATEPLAGEQELKTDLRDAFARLGINVIDFDPDEDKATIVVD